MCRCNHLDGWDNSNVGRQSIYVRWLFRLVPVPHPQRQRRHSQRQHRGHEEGVAEPGHQLGYRSDHYEGHEHRIQHRHPGGAPAWRKVLVRPES